MSERPRRWTDTLTLVLLCVALGAALVSATPALFRATGLGDRPADETSPRTAHFSLPPSGGAAQSRPLFGPVTDDDDDDPRAPELDRDAPEGALPGRRSADDRRRDRELFHPRPGRAEDPLAVGPRVHDAEHPSDGPGSATARFGVARRRLTLRDTPDEAGHPIGEIQLGDLVMVLKEVGDFAQVAFRGDDGRLMGWVKKSEIAVR